ncbi:hypothetical protein HPB48_007834 [Haemaphysalis longicornis]|uniref:Sulfotransferase domain-containing protein n=1 Tax=Haemaphysalis longicornis TaxID=44386 RepID=A0A9J6GE78_HAELO|nr:hypothetical protein HPB48_007834 [Haemaphysalis longicornis]
MSEIISISRARSAFERTHHVVRGIYLNTVLSAGGTFALPGPTNPWKATASSGTLSTSTLGRQRKDAFLEFAGEEGTRSSGSSTPIITHLPPHKTPHFANSKYIYVTKNPHDCCVLYYYHAKGFRWYNFAEGMFSEFFDMFVRGKMDCGDYFDHLLHW